MQWTDFQGQPAVVLRLASGACVTVLQQGAQPVSWRTADGVEHLYLSPRAVLDGQTPIRGGVPVCFPQFNMRGPLIKHGFARVLPWNVQALGEDRVTFALSNGVLSQAFWPETFTARLHLRLGENALEMALEVENTGTREWSFTAALHSYFQVGDVAQVQLQGLDGWAYWNALTDARGQQAGDVSLGAAHDSVYQVPVDAPAPEQTVRLCDASETAQRGTLHISQSASFGQVIVWNPAAEASAVLADMPDDGWRHMLCVEAGAIDEAIHLRPGETWQGQQHIRWQAAG